MIKSLPTRNKVNKARDASIWDHGNRLLYDLCTKDRLHNNREITLTKILFIGRIYAAAVERIIRKNQEMKLTSDKFYTQKVIPKLINNKIWERMENLRGLEKGSTESIVLALYIHSQLVDRLKTITNNEKRSLASKYLHFHMPDYFYLYDSRAEKKIRDYIGNLPAAHLDKFKSKKNDSKYSKFYLKADCLKNAIACEYKIKLSPRQIDNLLIK
ncbi:MAG: hypothetical protein KDC56_08195 [Flavobacteriaceae bacterium]|nr:hypothetical protein [Flavobacteriaceae bacterium]